MMRRGFTYLELIMSLTILAVLSAALVPASQKIVKRQKENRTAPRVIANARSH